MRSIVLAGLAVALAWAYDPVSDTKAELGGSRSQPVVSGTDFDNMGRTQNALKKIGDQDVLISEGETRRRRRQKARQAAARRRNAARFAADQGGGKQDGTLTSDSKGSGNSRVRGGSKTGYGRLGNHNFKDGEESKMSVAQGRRRTRARGWRDPRCRGSRGRYRKGCRVRYGNKKRGYGGMVPEEYNPGEPREGYFYIGKTKNKEEPLFYKTECVAKGRDKCATTKSSIVNRKNQVQMDCESTSSQYTCCKRSGRSGKKCNVEALTDRDGRTTTKLNGVLAQDSACEVRRRSSDGKYFCAAGKGVFKASSDKLQGTTSGRCYSRQKGGKEIKVRNPKFIRDKPSKTRYSTGECGKLVADLIFKGSWTNKQLQRAFRDVGVQLHGSISPAGKIRCQDQMTCAAQGFKESCYYCRLCETKKRAKSWAEGRAYQLPCDRSAQVNRPVKFEAKICPPSKTKSNMCPSMDGSVLGGYWEKKGDMDVRLEIYFKDSSKTEEQHRADFDRMRKASGILGFGQRLALKPHEIWAQTKARQRGSLDGPDGDPYVEAVWESYLGQISSKGELVGCSSYVGDYGAGKGATQALEVYKLAKSSGNPRDLIGLGKGKKCSRKAVFRI